MKVMTNRQFVDGISLLNHYIVDDMIHEKAPFVTSDEGFMVLTDHPVSDYDALCLIQNGWVRCRENGTAWWAVV